MREETEVHATHLQALFDASLADMQVASTTAAEWALEEALRAGQQAVADAEARHQTEVEMLHSAHANATAEAERTARATVEAEIIMHEAELSSFPPLIKKLMTAHKLGQLEVHSSTTELLTDIASCLESGTTRGRQFSPTSQVFYGLLLNNGSPWAHKFVSGVLFGPDLRTSQKARAAFESGVLGSPH